MKTIRVSAAVIRDGGKVLAAARGYGKYKGRWEFPGGKIEVGETPEQALVREIQEELNCEIRVGELIDTVEYDYPEFHLCMYCYWSELVSEEFELREALEARWLGVKELFDVDWLEADLGLIGKIKEELEGRNGRT